MNRPGRQNGGAECFGGKETEEGMIEELYAAHFQELRSFLRKSASDPALAEDIAQDTFLKALEHEDTLAGLGKSQRRAWLFRTARHGLIDSIRHQARRPELSAEEGFYEDFSGIEVKQILSVLSPRDQAIWQLRHLEGYNAGEIGELFGMKSDNVRARLSLMRKLLKAQL